LKKVDKDMAFNIMEKRRNVRRIFLGNPEGKRSLG
jgi:hypothetical protein